MLALVLFLCPPSVYMQVSHSKCDFLPQFMSRSRITWMAPGCEDDCFLCFLSMCGWPAVSPELLRVFLSERMDGWGDNCVLLSQLMHVQSTCDAWKNEYINSMNTCPYKCESMHIAPVTLQPSVQRHTAALNHILDFKPHRLFELSCIANVR